MTGWLAFWEVMLIAAFVIYTAMAVVVGIRAFGDIKALVRFLTEEHG